MDKKILTGLIAGIMFVGGLAAANPNQAIAANPVLEDIIRILTNPNFGLEEIKEEVSTIESEVLSEDHGLLEIKNEIRDIERRLGGVEQSLARIEQALEPPVCGDGVIEPPEQCESDSDCAADESCNSCSCVPSCGDGVIEPPEQCESDSDCAADESCNSCSCVPSCVSAPEACNGLDDDCDGEADEGNPGGGLSCITGLQGVCAVGTTTCSGESLECIGPAPTTETCNGLDDDCDGQADELGVCSQCSGQPNGTPCEDDLFCTIGDRCVSGQCVGTPIIGCIEP